MAHVFQSEAHLDRDEGLIRGEYLPVANTYCAWVESTLCGFLTLVENHIVALFVEPERHRRGIGATLIAHARSRRGALSVEVAANNVIALPFYTKHGFRYVRDEPNATYPDVTFWMMAQDGAVLP